jgi:hypothetical protein
MNHALTAAQQQQKRAELSRIYHTRLAEINEAIRALEADPAAHTVAEFDEQLRGWQQLRKALKAEWDRT